MRMRLKAQEKAALTLEEYINFFNGVHRTDLVVEQLNHIVFMHGFIRMHRRLKMDILNTLDSVDLMPPSRSTLEQTISAATLLTADEVKSDLEAIGWEESPVGSLKSISISSSSRSPAAKEMEPLSIAPALAAGSDGGRDLAAEKRKRAPRGKSVMRKRRLGHAGGAEAICLLADRPHNHM